MTNITTKIPYIPEGAPFSEDQKLWLGGFLAGLNSRLVASAGNVSPSDTQSDVKHLDIIFGTQTGNAEGLAEDAADLAREKGFSPVISEMDEIEMDHLSSMQNLIVVVSTYGEGEMPNNANQFWESLSASTAPRLENLKYGVLALGDTSYDEFCQAGKLIDMRLEQLGAERLVARVDCDVDYDDLAASWIETAIPDAASVASAKPTPKGQKKAKTGWGRKNPYISEMLDNRILSGSKSAKEIRHIVFDLGDSGMAYEAGDALGVMPVNAPDLVAAWLKRLKVASDTDIGGAPLSELLTSDLEIMTPSRELIRGIELVAENEELTAVVKGQDKGLLEKYLWGKDSLDLLNLCPNVSFDVAELVSWLKPLQHRAYSISSSPKAHKNEVHLTVAAVRWDYENRSHKGVCSTFLADNVPVGEQAGIFMSPNKNFRVPEDNSVPMIMVGPGTGVAPFFSFLYKR